MCADMAVGELYSTRAAGLDINGHTLTVGFNVDWIRVPVLRGPGRVVWNGRDESGRPVAPGA